MRHMHQKCQNPTKSHKKWAKIVQKGALSLYCITLAVICQALGVFSNGDVQAFGPTSQARQLANISLINNNGVNEFYFQDFTADYYLSKAEDGTSRLRVVEKLSAVFPGMNQNHGITRSIPFTNQGGKNLTMPSASSLNIKVKHNGIPVEPYKIETSEREFIVYIGNPREYVHGNQLYELEYEFVNVITSPDDNLGFQELYWNSNGTGWGQEFENLVARVHLDDPAVRQAFDGNVSCYVGSYGMNGADRCRIFQTADGVEFRANSLDAYENLTFDLEFQDHTFTIPPQKYSYRILGAVIVEIVVGLILVWGVFVVRHQTKRKRNYYHGLFVVPEYTPPSDFTVAEMATNYVGKKILGSSKVATLMELAVAGKVALTKVGDDKKPSWTVKVLSTDMKPEQADVVKLLAGRDAPLEVGQEILVKTHSPDSALVRLDRKFSQHVEKRLRATGLYEAKRNLATEVTDIPLETGATKPPKASKVAKIAQTNLCNIFLVFGILWIIISIIVLPFIIDGDLPSYVVLYGDTGLIMVMIMLAILIAVVAFMICAHYYKYYSHTEDGLKWSRYLDGLRMYIKMAKQDRLKFLQSVDGADTSPQGIVKLYEKLLPYAVVFRLEKSWLSELGKYYQLDDVSNPTWYSGSSVFNAADFSIVIRAVSAATVATDYSSSSSGGSSHSGSGGGGFSGGGGGGGGGGGW